MAGTITYVVVKAAIRPYTAIHFESCDIRRSAGNQRDHQGGFTIVA